MHNSQMAGITQFEPAFLGGPQYAGIGEPTHGGRLNVDSHGGAIALSYRMFLLANLQDCMVGLLIVFLRVACCHTPER